MCVNVNVDANINISLNICGNLIYLNFTLILILIFAITNFTFNLKTTRIIIDELIRLLVIIVR